MGMCVGEQNGGDQVDGSLCNNETEYIGSSLWIEMNPFFIKLGLLTQSHYHGETE